MSFDTQRAPLGEYSGSRLNKLHTTGLMDTLPGISGVTTSLPSLKSLIKVPKTPFEEIANRPIPFLHPMPGLRTDQLQISKFPPIVIQSQPLSPISGPDETLKDFKDLTDTLKIRLQFALYKFNTKQTMLKFKQIKKQHESRLLKAKTSSKSNSINKKRKLVVSHGNYKTPARSKSNPKHLEHTAPFSASSSHNTGLSVSRETVFSLDSNSQSFLSANNNTTTTNVTPIRSQKILKIHKQETPVNVKAAKSLLHLFTSNNNNNC
ncbi:hypothetical protein NCAS_0A04690 [Naumovozyma castellii]|uniref:Transcription factor NRM1 n=1 Tax=Naumovozyma castellii TaxID=27288 RepID=G0V6D5_NAUCA|nr:hypothetical protein NCAS_0A04690 [Naumovozyma castellii CBS 4309]CCC67027.1 hypothetical protein NCAS_0A04690 [Naumovozyma castellii CBS 4309]